MKRRYLFALISCCLLQLVLATGEESYSGLTQAQLAKKVGFPHRVVVLTIKAHGGPGVLFWYYYQRSSSGHIEKKMFAFDGEPLRVRETDLGIEPSRFLSLDRSSDLQKIREYEAAHP